MNAKGWVLKKADVVLILGTLILATALYFIIYLTDTGHGSLSVAVYADGELYGTVSLNGEPKEMEIITRLGINTVTFYSDGFAVTESDCLSKDCIRSGKAEKYYQSIICLPNKLLVQFESNGQGEVDAVAK